MFVNNTSVDLCQSNNLVRRLEMLDKEAEEQKKQKQKRARGWVFSRSVKVGNEVIDQRFDNEGIPYSGRLEKLKRASKIKTQRMAGGQSPLTEEERREVNKRHAMKDPTARFGII